MGFLGESELPLPVLSFEFRVLSYAKKGLDSLRYPTP